MKPIQAVIFDLDGTLTVPVLDFDAIRKETGLEGPILEELPKLDEKARRRTLDVLARHEKKAALESQLNPGARNVLQRLRQRSIRTAILTRNSRASLDTVVSLHGIEVDARRSRDDGTCKPSPEPVLDLCDRLGVLPEETLVVGDTLFDLQAARRAGATSALLLNSKNGHFTGEADHAIRNLEATLELVGE